MIQSLSIDGPQIAAKRLNPIRAVTDLSYDHFMKLDLDNMIMYFTVMPNVILKNGFLIPVYLLW